jgi:hypothetical protein
MQVVAVRRDMLPELMELVDLVVVVVANIQVEAQLLEQQILEVVAAVVDKDLLVQPAALVL